MVRLIVALALVASTFGFTTIARADEKPAKECKLKAGCYSREAGSDCKYEACKTRQKADKAERKAIKERLKREAHDREVSEQRAKETVAVTEASRRELAKTRFTEAIREASCIYLEASSGSTYSRNRLKGWVIDVLGAERGYARITTKRTCEAGRLLWIVAREYWEYSSRNYGSGRCARADLSVHWDDESEAFLDGWGASCESDDAYYPRRHAKTDEVRRSEALKATLERLR
ncbi:MAG TPA: hypothetical protein VJG48_01925 [Candidatus Paceibacterota bacterium]